ncbi:uncharacterized protein Aud_009632 [Aspergillus udagawae]|uniref:Magnesium transport protein CorA n=1 Tax=Aspergillus udagawae TaxID=91492 RepID=A0A8E0R279_9EURO|nr:uncharacterized protein Aud_009632 [Aspergillus udagawae]GIC93151.1 hypothetical protein Aud_009632 [Aspergillus udagawae]
MSTSNPRVVQSLKLGGNLYVPSIWINSAGSLTLLQSSKRSEYVKQDLNPEEVEDWIEEKGTFTNNNSRPFRRVRLIFPCTSPTALDVDGNYLSSNETLELAISQERFTQLTQRYHFASVLDAWRYRSLSGCSVRKIEHDSSGEVTSIIFTISIRLSGSFASILAINHDFAKNSAVVLALRVSTYDQTLLQQALERHHDLIGHPLLVPTTLVEICLETNKWFSLKILRELSVVEKATGQHGWLQIPAADAPAHDSELSRLGHAVKQYISISRRRLDSIQCYLDMIMRSVRDLENHIPEGRAQYEQWIGNIELLLKFRQVDMTYSERRADNQITAIYGLISQRDNMVGVSVAIESKKVSEASKRDGSVLKSLAVLTAVFFPATSIATLFALPHFSDTPLWVYWVIVVPLTLVIFSSWACWTFYRQRQMTHDSSHRDIEEGIQLHPERDFPPSASFLASTLCQIRSQTKHLHSPQ